jgi:hypothetical protein
VAFGTSISKSGIKIPINYIQLGLGLNPLACGFLPCFCQMRHSALRINNLNSLAKLDGHLRSLGMSIALVTSVE